MPLIFSAMRGFVAVRGSSVGSNSAQRAPSSIGTPAATSCASPCCRLVTPSRPFRSSATARCGRPFRMRPTSPLSTEPGPTSTKTRAPAAYIASICSTKRTGFAICPPSVARIAAASLA